MIIPATLPSDAHLRFTARALATILDNPSSSDLVDLSDRLGLSIGQALGAFIECTGVLPEKFAEAVQTLATRDRADAAHSISSSNLNLYKSAPNFIGFLHGVHCAVGVLPASSSARGAGLSITEGFFHTIFGLAHCARCPRGILRLHLLDSEDYADLDASRSSLRTRFPEASIHEGALGDFDDIRQALKPASAPAPKKPLRLLLSGTPFQNKALLAIAQTPFGATASYAYIAMKSGAPRAYRAAGSAMGSNAIALFIPCHRALRADDSIGSYHWKTWRKQALLALEFAALDGRVERRRCERSMKTRSRRPII